MKLNGNRPVTREKEFYSLNKPTIGTALCPVIDTSLFRVIPEGLKGICICPGPGDRGALSLRSQVDDYPC